MFGGFGLGLCEKTSHVIQPAGIFRGKLTLAKRPRKESTRRAKNKPLGPERLVDQPESPKWEARSCNQSLRVVGGRVRKKRGNVTNGRPALDRKDEDNR